MNNIRIPKVKINFILTLVLALVLLWELYLAYIHIFKNFNQELPEVASSNIVRVNLENYRKTIDLLEEQENFAPAPVNFLRSNPFRP
ncbi:MAG: hypothetical protein HYV13_03320 [Candidatus Doudnabacteria bacterium]|nr:hypothetical protein [Candidatus Doudnabacteria bacterium]